LEIHCFEGVKLVVMLLLLQPFLLHFLKKKKKEGMERPLLLEDPSLNEGGWGGGGYWNGQSLRSCVPKEVVWYGSRTRDHRQTIELVVVVLRVLNE
jgi:hypothetical protein